jgi:hypothetical protein
MAQLSDGRVVGQRGLRRSAVRGAVLGHGPAGPSAMRWTTLVHLMRGPFFQQKKAVSFSVRTNAGGPEPGPEGNPEQSPCGSRRRGAMRRCVRGVFCVGIGGEIDDEQSKRW